MRFVNTLSTMLSPMDNAKAILVRAPRRNQTRNDKLARVWVYFVHTWASCTKIFGQDIARKKVLMTVELKAKEGRNWQADEAPVRSIKAPDPLACS